MFTVALVVGALAACGNWWSRATESATARRVEEVTKPLVTVAAIVIAATSGGSVAAIVWVAIALVLCLVGDVALLPRVGRFLWGLAAFLTAHVVFAAGFIARGLESARVAGIALVIVALAAAAAAPTVLRGAAARGVYRAVRLYLVVISAMVVVGWATRNWAIAAGSAAFFVSDGLLGWREFVASRRWMAVAVMVTYHAAILLLAWSPRL